MILFDQLRISDNGKNLYIDAHVNKAENFDNAFIESVTIMTADKVSETAPEMYTEDYIYKKTFEGDVKEIHLFLGKEDFDAAFINVDTEGSPIDDAVPVGKVSYSKDILSNDLFFVYVNVRWEGEPDSCLPCSVISLPALGVTFDETLLYQKAMQFTKALADECRVSREYIDFILLWNGFKAAIETEHYNPAISFWKKMFFVGGGISGINTVNPCGCHG